MHRSLKAYYLTGSVTMEIRVGCLIVIFQVSKHSDISLLQHFNITLSLGAIPNNAFPEDTPKDFEGIRTACIL